MTTAQQCYSKSPAQNAVPLHLSGAEAAHHGDLANSAGELLRLMRLEGAGEDFAKKVLEADDKLIKCLLSHLRAEFPRISWPRGLDDAVGAVYVFTPGTPRQKWRLCHRNHVVWPQQVSETLWLVSRRRTFVGTCEICGGWEQRDDSSCGSHVRTLDLVMEFLESKTGFIHENSRTSYRHTLCAFAKHCPIYPTTPQELEGYFARYNGGRGAASAYPVIKLLYDFGEERRGLPNPVKSIHRPRIKEAEKRSFSLAEFKAIVEACRDDRELAIVHLEGGHGFRPNEAISMTASDIGERDVFVSAGKVRKEYMPLLPETRAILLRLAGNASNGPIFIGRSGRHLSDRMAYNIVSAVMRRNGLNLTDCSPYTLRHSFSTLAQEAGMEFTAAQRLMRHRKRSMTEHYTHFSQEYLRQQLEKFSPLRLINQQVSTEGGFPKILSCSTVVEYPLRP